MQRQRFPASAARISASVGFAFDARSAAVSHQHSGGADAALRAAALPERLLDGVEPCGLCVPIRQSFDGTDLRARRLAGRDQAGVDERAVDEHGAGAALAFAAAFLGAGEGEVLAQHVEQPLHRRYVGRPLPAVHLEAQPHAGLPVAAFAAQARAIRSGVAGIRSRSIASASAMAFTAAGAPPSMGSSPMPLAPNGPCA